VTGTKSRVGNNGKRPRDVTKERAPAEADALRTVKSPYGFFSAHVLVAASHVPPAFAQSASVFAAVTSPAKAGPVKASARVNAKIERRVFMAFTPLRWT
jgi:hypothetical protein